MITAYVENWVYILVLAESIKDKCFGEERPETSKGEQKLESSTVKNEGQTIDNWSEDDQTTRSKIFPSFWVKCSVQLRGSLK